MKALLLLPLFSLLGTPAVSAQVEQAEASVHRIIPIPRQVVTFPQSFKLTGQTRMILGEHATSEDQFAAQQFNARLSEMGKNPLRLASEEGVRKISKNFIFLGSPQSAFARQWMKSRNVTLNPEMKEEGYVLVSTQDEVVILGESAAGRFYGVMSLIQLLEQQKKALLVPSVMVRDWPEEKFRGISDDVSRGQISTMENFKKIIRFLARHKLNVYSPYIEDIFTFRSHPLIGKGRDQLTATQVRELDAYAKQYHVELVPTFETLGHWENILVLPEYVKYAEFPGAHTLNVSDEAVYTMLDEMIGEMSSAFSSPYFNMAADESWDVGLGTSKARVAASDLATVHAEHYKRLFDILKKYKKKPMMYGDVILNNPTILDKIPKDVVIIDWHYGTADQYPSPVVFKNAGFPFVVSPAVWNFTGPFPNYINTTINVQNLNRDGYRNGSLGVLTSNWNDYGGEALRELNYYGYAWTAECAWRPLRADLAQFNAVFFREFFGNEEAALAGQTVYTLLSNPLNQINWQELWRHPFLQVRQAGFPVSWRFESLVSTMPLVLQSVEALRRRATLNQEHLRALAFVARLDQWFAQKGTTADELRRAVQDTIRGASKDSLIRSALVSARAVADNLRKLKEEFRSVWLETNRTSNLSLLMMRYDRQLQYWDEIIESVERRRTLNDPLIESQWIYHPNANPRTRDSSLVQIPKAYFRKTISIHRPPMSAKLQLIGDTRARLWVNGIEVGEVYARRSLSLFVEHQRVKMWEIGALLKDGDNSLAVEAENYDRFGSAGINVYGEVRTGGEVTKILSDSTWNVAAKAPEGWQTVQLGDQSWVQAASKSYPFQIIQPNFDAGRLSWIER